jgi:hypothetical protein
MVNIGFGFVHVDFFAGGYQSVSLHGVNRTCSEKAMMTYPHGFSTDLRVKIDHFDYSQELNLFNIYTVHFALFASFAVPNFFTT